MRREEDSSGACQDLFSKPLDLQTFRKDAKTYLSVV